MGSPIVSGHLLRGYQPFVRLSWESWQLPSSKPDVLVPPCCVYTS